MTQHETNEGAPEGEHFEEGEEQAPPGTRAMAVVRWLLVLALATAAVMSLVHVFGDKSHAQEKEGVTYYCPMHPAVTQDHPGECPICGMTLVARAEEGEARDSAPANSHAGHRHEPSDPYACPMHPEETGTSAEARCPLCKMKLTPKKQKPKESPTPAPAPKHADHPAPKQAVEPTGAKTVIDAAPAGLSAVTLAPDRVQRIGMRTATVTRVVLPSGLRASAVVAPTERGASTVQIRYSGWIEQLMAGDTGQQVRAGELLARIFSPELLNAQHELLNAVRWARNDDSGQVSLLENARNRLRLMGMEATQIAEVERTGEAQRLIEVRAPTRGYVVEKLALEGLFVQPGTALFRIADLSRVWAVVDVFERDAGRIHKGQAAILTLTAYPGETFHGKVELVYPELNTETRTLRARIVLANRDLRLKPGMFGDVAIALDAGEGLVIPREALVDAGARQYVFVVDEPGHFSPRSVRTGVREGEVVQIVEGLREGETVVATGNFLLDSESRLRAAIDAPTTHVHTP